MAHGESNYQFFTTILDFYAKRNPKGDIRSLNALYASLLGCDEEPGVLYPALDKVLSSMVQKRPLREYGMREEECEGFADSVLERQQRLLGNNYVPMDREEIVDIYRKLY